jgi:hypothetical protein
MSQSPEGIGVRLALTDIEYPLWAHDRTRQRKHQGYRFDYLVYAALRGCDCFGCIVRRLERQIFEG